MGGTRGGARVEGSVPGDHAEREVEPGDVVGDQGARDELRLEPGVLAIAAVKSTNVVVELPEAP